MSHLVSLVFNVDIRRIRMLTFGHSTCVHVHIAVDQNTIENLDGRLFEYLVNSVPGLAELPPFTTEPSLNQFYVYDTMDELVDELCERDFKKWVNTHNKATNDTMKLDRRVRYTILTFNVNKSQLYFYITHNINVNHNHLSVSTDLVLLS